MIGDSKFQHKTEAKIRNIFPGSYRSLTDIKDKGEDHTLNVEILTAKNSKVKKNVTISP